MRVRVKFRYRADTGEVEVFQVEDLREGPRQADHDARHDHAAAEVARLVENNALIQEVLPGGAADIEPTDRRGGQQPEQRRERRLRE